MKCRALHAPPAGGDKSLGDVALAPAIVRGVDRKAEGCVAGRDGTLGVIVYPPRIAAYVELVKAQRFRRGGGELLQPRIANRAEHMRHAELLDGARHRRRAESMEAFQ